MAEEKVNKTKPAAEEKNAGSLFVLLVAKKRKFAKQLNLKLSVTN